ncbi:MAG: YfhO family protein [Bacteroidetes bacterium]|nr:YfhO family protein [Bacteroidota bacterium]
MKNFNFKSLIQPLAIIALFFVSMMIYFAPKTIDGKQLQTHDVQQYQGMAKEQLDHNEQVKKTGEGSETLWTNSMFGGMPTYLIGIYPNNLTKKVHQLFNTNHKHPEMIAFMYFLCFFVALLLFEIPLWLCFLGALFYGFSSYFFIIIEAGHVTKSVALGYMPLVVASVAACYRNKLWLGSALFALTLSFLLIANHLQITYYTMYIILAFVLFQLYEAWRAKDLWKQFLKPSLFLLVAAVFAIGANAANLYMTYDYGKDTMRGKSELTHDAENKTKGLDRDYATAWSYGIDETFNLFIPNFKGGASGGSLGEDSETYKAFRKIGYSEREAKQYIQQMPLYWGTQSFTSGPVYIGAIVIFLFVFGLMFVRGSVKWWLASLTALSILLAWGSNFMWFTNLFLDFVPGYNKFRTVSMILVIAQFTMPLLAIIALHQFVRDESRRKEGWEKLKIALYICGGLVLVLLVSVGSIYDFGTPRDVEQYKFPDWLVQSLQADRKSMLISDLWRTLLFVAVTFGTLTLWYFKKIKYPVLIAILAVFTYFDMWSVNKRYLNEQDFVKQRAGQQHFQPTEANKAILADPDPNFRVMNFTVSPFNDASTSYFHKSIGGYHGAKMQRYQDLIDFHLSKMNWNVYNMLNTKYLIVENPQTRQPIAQPNPDALGNAWFIKNLHFVPNADAEIEALSDFNPAAEAFVDVRFANQLTDTVFTVDSTSSIMLTSYAPNHITYTSHNAHAGVAVFSEIYYSKGWNAYINGKLVPHFRVNYVLRALNIPAGTHTIDFKFEPHSYTVSNRISFIASLLLLLGVAVVVFFEVRKKLNERK